jgi:hypothetical protein
MHERVLLKRIAENPHPLVHEKTVQRPFEKRRHDRSRCQSNPEPKEKSNHNELLSINGSRFNVVPNTGDSNYYFSRQTCGNKLAPREIADDSGGTHQWPDTFSRRSPCFSGRGKFQM